MTECSDHLIDRISERDALHFHFELPCIGKCEVSQIIHQLVEKHYFVVKRGEVADLLRYQAILHCFDLTSDIRQRRSEFMSDIAHHVAPQLFNPRQIGGHVVEGDSQFTDLVDVIPASAGNRSMLSPLGDGLYRS